MLNQKQRSSVQACLADIGATERVGACQWKKSSTSAGVAEHPSGFGIMFLGVSRCNMVWLCPNCSRYSDWFRNRDLEIVTDAWRGEKSRIVVAAQGNDLESALDSVTHGWGEVQRNILRGRAKFWRVSSVSYLEDEQQWLAEYHIQLLWTDGRKVELEDAMPGVLAGQGAFMYDEVDDEWFGDSDRPWNVVLNYIATKDESWAELWREYEAATFGKMHLGISRGLRKASISADGERLLDETARLHVLITAKTFAEIRSNDKLREEFDSIRGQKGVRSRILMREFTDLLDRYVLEYKLLGDNA